MHIRDRCVGLGPVGALGYRVPMTFFESPTYGMEQVVHLSRTAVQQVLIPAGVWHCNVNVAPQETFLVNFPTTPYRYEAPDRMLLPWNTDRIPVRVDRFFPKQFLSWDESPD